MADIFKNIGKAITAPIGGLAQGIYQGIAPGAWEQEISQRERQRLQALLQAAPTPQAQAAIARKWMEEHEPEISKMISEKDWQPQQQTGTLPGAYQYLTEEEKREASLRYGGLKPRATSPFAELDELLNLQASIGTDLEGKQRFPRLKKVLDERIKGFQLPGQPPQRPGADLQKLAGQTDPWLGAAAQKPAPPAKGKFWDRIGALQESASKPGNWLMDKYEGLERGVDKAFQPERKTPSKTPRADVAQNADQVLMWLRWEVPLSREISGRVQQYRQVGYKPEAIVKALRSFSDMSKITVEEFDKVMQGVKAEKADPLGIR